MVLILVTMAICSIIAQDELPRFQFTEWKSENDKAYEDKSHKT